MVGLKLHINRITVESETETRYPNTIITDEHKMDLTFKPGGPVFPFTPGTPGSPWRQILQQICGQTNHANIIDLFDALYWVDSFNTNWSCLAVQRNAIRPTQFTPVFIILANVLYPSSPINDSSVPPSVAYPWMHRITCIPIVCRANVFPISSMLYFNKYWNRGSQRL